MGTNDPVVCPATQGTKGDGPRHADDHDARRIYQMHLQAQDTSALPLCLCQPACPFLFPAHLFRCAAAIRLRVARLNTRFFLGPAPEGPSESDVDHPGGLPRWLPRRHANCPRVLRASSTSSCSMRSSAMILVISMAVLTVSHRLDGFRGISSL